MKAHNPSLSHKKHNIIYVIYIKVKTITKIYTYIVYYIIIEVIQTNMVHDKCDVTARNSNASEKH